MSDSLVAPVMNGQVQDTSTKTTTAEVETRGTSNLGKDAFLQLLVAEMQNQDPLEPSSNTEWISQLATFSQLEEMQTLTHTTEASQMFSLIGKQVTVKSTDAKGDVYLKSGTVDFVSTSGGETKFSVKGSLYSINELYSVSDDTYYYESHQPSVVKEVEFSFNGDDPRDMTFEVNLGDDIAEAHDVALMIGKTVLSPQYAYLNGNTVTIKSEIMQQLEPGIYNVDVVFDDKNYTTVYDAVKIYAYNTHPTAETAEETETDISGITEDI